jgi:hypothetical protein
MKHLLTEWPPLSSRGLCGIVGAAALALIALARRQRLSVPRHMRLRLLRVSMLTIGGWVAFMGLALLWLNASEAAVLGISIPVWVALLAWPILGEPLSLLRAIALTIAVAGITVLIGGNGIDAIQNPDCCAHRRAVCVALGTVLTLFSVGDAAVAGGLTIGIAFADWVSLLVSRPPSRRCSGRLGDDLYDADPILPGWCAGSRHWSDCWRRRRRSARCWCRWSALAAGAMPHEPLGWWKRRAGVYACRRRAGDTILTRRNHGQRATAPQLACAVLVMTSHKP